MDLYNKFKNLIIRILVFAGLIKFIRLISGYYEYNLDKSSSLNFPYIKRRREQVFQILAYHRVNSQADPVFPPLPVEAFEAQIKLLNEYFNILPLEEIMERIRTNSSVENMVAITFDDGYKDVYTHAYPILLKYYAPATVFLATGVIGTDNVLWYEKVFSGFRSTTKSHLEIKLNNDLQKVRYNLDSLDKKIHAQTEILKFLRSQDEKSRDLLVENLLAALDVRTIVPSPMLSWNEIHEMHKNRISFGAHTVSHPILTRIPLDRARDEIALSKSAIEKQLKAPVNLFAYPNGLADDFNTDIQRILKELGFVASVTSIFGSNPLSQNPYELRRSGPWGDSSEPFLIKIRLMLNQLYP